MKLGRFVAWFWSVVGGVSIRVKIMGIVLVLILIFGLGITLQIRNSLVTTLTDQLQKQGVAITRDLGARSTDLILTGNLFDLYQLLDSTVKNNDAVRYAIILGDDGSVLSHSFGGSLPVGLAETNPVEPDTMFQIETLDTNEGKIWDIAVPILGGRAGIARVGMSSRYLLESVSATTRRLLITTGLVLVIGLLAAYLLTLVLVRPIIQLAEATKAITRGNLKHRAPVWASDEIGKLGIAFNAMTQYLAKSRNESEAFHAELLRRNRELSALNAVIIGVSRPQGLANMMHHSLAEVLEAMGLNAGWVSTLTEDGKQTTLICQEGLTREIVQKIDTVRLSSCACKAAVRKRSPVVIQDSGVTCPILGNRLGNGQPLLCHATVPLISKSQVFGLLHVASSKPSQFTAEDIQLLSAIGHQMGVAIENARLWEELRRKEEVRGQLLKGTISAQEAERKRIARELHDQTGQSLTSLMIGLGVVEAQAPEEMQEAITDLKRLTAQTLDEVHNLALELRPSSLDDLGLIAALRRYAEEYTDKVGVKADFQAIGFEKRRLQPQMEIALYRIIQEALTNVAKHSAAKRVSILMEIRGSSIVAIVEDDGRGFDVQKVLSSRTGGRNLGLHGMKERAALIDGVLTIESTPGVATTVFVEVPLQEV